MDLNNTQNFKSLLAAENATDWLSAEYQIGAAFTDREAVVPRRWTSNAHRGE
jgi:hypothetical protein